MQTRSWSPSSTGTSRVRHRLLGPASVSEIGFGTWGLGGTRHGAVAYGPTDDAESLAALRRAHALGVTFYDTSDLYGGGHSETLLGQAFAHQRHSVFLATKAGFLNADGRQDFSVEHLEDALQGSLRRLRTDHVDLFQLHSPPLEALCQDAHVIDWLVGLKSRGLARLIGISVRSPADGLRVVCDFPIDAIQVNFNLLDQRALENGLLQLCADRRVGAIVRTPLCFGFLSGAVSGGDMFPAGDHRNRWSTAQRERWCQAAGLFWQSVSEQGRQTPAQFALRFCLSQPGVKTVIPGMLTVAQVEENLRASALGSLDEDELHGVAELYRGQNFFLGK